MVLQIRETMVLQRVERKGKGNPPHLYVFGLPVALMRKHGFAEKLHSKWKWLLTRLELLENFAARTRRYIRNAASELEKIFLSIS